VKIQQKAKKINTEDVQLAMNIKWRNACNTAFYLEAVLKLNNAITLIFL
jgi:hypothetical protein